MIKWTFTKAEHKLADRIAARAQRLANERGFQYEIEDASMDVLAVHCNDVPLRLSELLEADDFNFAHDMFGIRIKLDRTTGKLKDGFVPRYSNG